MTDSAHSDSILLAHQKDVCLAWHRWGLHPSTQADNEICEIFTSPPTFSMWLSLSWWWLSPTDSIFSLILCMNFFTPDMSLAFYTQSKQVGEYAVLRQVPSR